MAGRFDFYTSARGLEAMQDQDGLLDEMQFDAELEGFLSGSAPSAGMVNLQPIPSSFASEPPSGQMDLESAAAPTGKLDESSSASSLGPAAAAAAAAATAGAVGGALFAGKFGDASGIMGQAAGTVLSSVGTAAVPTSLQPVKETAGRFLSKAQPWREFCLPLASPNSADGCSRLTSNVYTYQTNYAILFVIFLLFTIMLQPSALVSIVVIILVWMIFLKKNDDPEWKPELGGVQLGPMQRWLLLAAVTAIILLMVAGSTIFNSALMFLAFIFCHGLVHDTASKSETSDAVPL